MGVDAASETVMNRGGGASRNPRLSARLVSEPEKVIAEVRQAIKRTGGNVTAAAFSLGISDRTLFRWVQRFPAMLEGIER